VPDFVLLVAAPGPTAHTFHPFQYVVHTSTIGYCRIANGGRMTFEDTSAAIDFQFSAAAQPGALSEKSPLAALGLFTYLCRWSPQTKTVECGDVEWLSMEMLLKGQAGNRTFEELYRSCRSSFSSRWDFWLFVVRSSGNRPANHDEAQLRMIQQALNEPNTISSARWACKASKGTADPENKKFFQILAMYFLLFGQRHSADTMQLYRACFKGDPDELFRRLEMLTPIDIEDVAIDLEAASRSRTTQNR